MIQDRVRPGVGSLGPRFRGAAEIYIEVIETTM
jgi:hypothetical protein